MANNETVLKIKAQIDGLQGLEKLKSSMKRISAEVDGAENNFSELLQKLKQLQSSSVKSLNNLNAQRDAFDALRRSVDVTSKEFKEARDEIEKIDRALKEASGTVVKYSKNSINALRAQKNELLAVRDSADLMSKEFKEAGVELAKLDKKLAKAEGRGRGGRLKGAAQIAGTVAGAGVFGGPEGAIGALGGGLIGGVGGAVLGGALGAQVSQLRKAAGGVAEYNAELNLAKATLAGVSTDIVDYNKNLEFARRISNDYAISLLNVVKGYSGVAAAARANNLTVKQTQGIYEGITASGIAFGKSQEDLQALFLATTQVLSKGKASAEEISGQIGERIPGAVAKFAEATNRTLPQLAKAFQDGEVTIADFVLFAEKQGEDYAEFAKSLASGPEKAGIRLDIALKKAMEIYGSFFGSVGAGFQNLLKTVVDFVIENEKQIKTIIGGVVVLYKDVSSLLKDLADGIAKTFGPVFTFLIKGINAVITKAVAGINTLLKLKRIDTRTVEALQTQARTQVEKEMGGFLGLGITFRQNKAGERYREVFDGLVQEELNKVDLGPSFLDRAGKQGESLFPEYKPSKFAGANTNTTPTPGLDSDLDGNGNGSGRSGVDKALVARNAALKLSEILDRQLRDISLKTEGIGASAEQAIENQFAKAFNKAADKTDDLRAKLANYEAEAGQAFPEITGKINELELALVDAADAQRAFAMQQLADKRFGEKLKGYGFTGEALDAGGKIFALGALDQQAFPTGVDSILNPNKLKESIKEIKKGLEELVNPVNQIVGAANAIGDSFAQSFKSVINGSATAQQALASFFQNIGSYFLDMAAKILAEMIKISILNAVTGLLPGLGSSAGSGFNLGGFGSLSPDAASGTSGFLAGVNFSGRANGGPVSANTPYIVGERGPEMFVPFQSGQVLSNNETEAMMSSAFQRNGSVNLPFTRNSETLTAARDPGPIDVRYESQVINGVEYVTAEQHRKGMAQAAERGRALTLQTLQNSPRTRNKVGI